MKTLPIKLARGEHIIAVVPEYASGPGWANKPVWVHIRGMTGMLRSECIQPEEHTEALRVLFKSGAAMCEALRIAVPTKRKKEALE